MRQMASIEPLPAPYCCNAMMAYLEHVGVYRHEAGSQGEMINW
jgi:hypothetical protein